MNFGLGIWKRKKGIKMKELTEAVEFVVSLANGLGKAAEDGEVGAGDFAYLLPLLYKLPSAVDGVGKIPAELKEIDAEKMSVLTEMVKEKLDVPQDKIELAVEGGLDIAVRLYALVQKLKA